jgi:hypothetical protein
MKKLALILSLVLVTSASALTLTQTRTAADVYIDSIEDNARTRIQVCLADREDCSTAWSCTSPCNTTSGAGSICQNTQTDQGRLDPCGVATGTHTFASRGIALPSTAPVCFRLVTYEGPGGRGGALCYRAQHAGITYERCRGFGPQATNFSSNWAPLMP